MLWSLQLSRKGSNPDFRSCLVHIAGATDRESRLTHAPTTFQHLMAPLYSKNPITLVDIYLRIGLSYQRLVFRPRITPTTEFIKHSRARQHLSDHLFRRQLRLRRPYYATNRRSQGTAVHAICTLKIRLTAFRNSLRPHSSPLDTTSPERKWSQL